MTSDDNNSQSQVAAADSASSPPIIGTTPASGDGRKALPKGVVLGKDGKPCRSCTSFASWATQTKSNLKAASTVPRSDCPPNVEQLGRSSWTLLHSIAITYPENPSPAQRSDILDFVKLFSKLYPCWVCAEDFQAYLKQNSPRVGSRSEFGQWLCDAHNDVNVKLGKKVFDCSKWEERWSTGWKDGSCD